MHKLTSVWKSLRRRWLIVLAGTLVTALTAITIASPRLVPYSMDEFISYQTLGCVLHPTRVAPAVMKTTTENCHLYDLRIPKTTQPLPLRTYRYIGSLPGLVYAPFRFLIHSPISVRIQGLVFLLAASLLLARLIRVRLGYVLLASLVFPMYAFSFIVDTGPIGLQVVLLLSILLLIRRAYESKVQRTSDYYLLASGVLAFLGFWIKPNFSWLLPVIGCYIFFRPFIRGSDIRKVWRTSVRRLVPFAVGFGPPTAVLISTVDRGGTFYGEYIASLNLRVHNISEFMSNAKRLLGLVTHGNNVSSVAVTIPGRPQDYIPLLVLLGLVSFGVWCYKNGKIDRRPLLALGAAAVVFVIEIISYGAATHHLVLAWVFVVMAMAFMLTTVPLRVLAVTAAIISVYWVNLLTRLPSAKVYAGANGNKDRLLTQIWKDHKQPTTAQVNLNWGTYYISNLFSSRSQKVLYYDINDQALLPLVSNLSLLGQDGVEQMVVTVNGANVSRVQRAFTGRYGQPTKTYQQGDWHALVYRLKP